MDNLFFFSPPRLQSKAAKFFTITAQTMESFVKSLSEDTKQQDLDSDENQFVLALAGIVTSKLTFSLKIAFHVHWEFLYCSVCTATITAF